MALGNRNGVFTCMRTAMATLKEIVQEGSYELPPESCRGLGMELKDFEVISLELFVFSKLHYSTKKRYHVLDILKSLFSSDTHQSMKRRIATER